MAYLAVGRPMVGVVNEIKTLGVVVVMAYPVSLGGRAAAGLVQTPSDSHLGPIFKA
jgi:hypothetical protein